MPDPALDAWSAEWIKLFSVFTNLCTSDLSFYIEVRGRYQGQYSELLIKFFFHVSGDIFLVLGQQPTLIKLGGTFICSCFCLVGF